MYQDLRSKLQLYKKNQGEVSPPAYPADVHAVEEDVLGGQICRGEAGCCYLWETRYPAEHLHGQCRMKEGLALPSRLLRMLNAEVPSGLDPHDLLLLDTETTGLSGGTGTVAFLIGLGTFEGDAFVIRQYFMRDYDEEAAMLEEMNRRMEGRRVLVTFNGKAFDWNLLLSRFTFQRIRPACRDPIHLDILYPARKIWKLKHESCRLSYLEEQVAGFVREDDIPGAKIPGVYFQYLQDRNPDELKKVVTHNAWDILSMLVLLVKIASMLDNPLELTDGSRELLGVGRIFEDCEQLELMTDCYQWCRTSEDHLVREMAARRLADKHKKNQNYALAVETWEDMLDKASVFNYYPMLELAKYYEHKAKDISRAAQVVEKAIRDSNQAGFTNNPYYADLKKRLERLRRKAERKQAE